MASFFGEVVFPSSRAFWDGDDDNGSPESLVNPPIFTVRWLKEKPKHIKTLILMEGEMLIDFTKECLCQNSNEICFVEDEKQQKVLTIYPVHDDAYLCIVSPRFDIKFSVDLINKISDILSSTESTISIVCRLSSEFKTDNIPKEPSFLRMLTTKSGEKLSKLKVKLLERPNLCYGFTAGVLSYAEIMDLPSVLYVLYADHFILDSIIAKPLLELFEAMNCTPNNVKFSGKNYFNKGNLYM